MNRTLRGAWSRRGTLLPLLLLTVVVVAGAVTVIGFADRAGTSPRLAVPLLLLGRRRRPRHRPGARQRPPHRDRDPCGAYALNQVSVDNKTYCWWQSTKGILPARRVIDARDRRAILRTARREDLRRTLP